MQNLELSLAVVNTLTIMIRHGLVMTMLEQSREHARAFRIGNAGD
jgi:hypothetical protein